MKKKKLNLNKSKIQKLSIDELEKLENKSIQSGGRAFLTPPSFGCTTTCPPPDSPPAFAL